MSEKIIAGPMDVKILCRQSVLAVGLLLALGGCSVTTPYRIPAAALAVPLEEHAGWHLASGAEREGTAAGQGDDAASAAFKGFSSQDAAGAGRTRGTASSAVTAGMPGEPLEGRFASVSLVDGAAFRDPVLQGLLQRQRSGNLSLLQAEARLRQAQAVLAGAGASRLPQVGISSGAVRSGSTGREGAGRGAAAVGGSAGAGDAWSGLDQSSLASLMGKTGPSNSVQAGTSISWVPDLWGKIAAQIESGRASLQAAEAERRAVELQMQVSLIQSYWRMRLAEARLLLLARSVATAERSLRLIRNQYHAGLVARADVVQAETRLQLVMTQRHEMERSRGTERHAMAVLLGLPPSALGEVAFSSGSDAGHASAGLDASAPPVMLPSVPPVPDTLSIDLLRRRPNVSAAERQVASANAELGLARGAWLPDITLSAAGSLSASTVASLLSAPLRSWSLGAQLASYALFDGGARRAALQKQEAAYDEKVAAYRLQVLTALQEIEDGLLARRTLARQETDQKRLVALAQEAEQVVRNRYQGGLVSYTELSTAESSSISAQDQLLALQAERLNNYITLLAAIGGSWQTP